MQARPDRGDRAIARSGVGPNWLVAYPSTVLLLKSTTAGPQPRAWLVRGRRLQHLLSTAQGSQRTAKPLRISWAVLATASGLEVK